MFFDRPKSASSTLQRSAAANNPPPTWRRPWAALALAAALAVPVGLVGSARLAAQEARPTGADQPTSAAAANTAVSSAELLKQGIAQFKDNQYEEAQATLQQVKASDLPAKDRRTLGDYLGKAQAAATQRKNARSEFVQGQAALKDSKPADAIVHFRAAVDNDYADAGTRQKAQEQIALAYKTQDQQADQLKGVYKQAVSDYDAGRRDQAKPKFEQLQAAGYKVGMFQKSPRAFLKTIADDEADAKALADRRAATTREAAARAAKELADRQAKEQAKAKQETERQAKAKDAQDRQAQVKQEADRQAKAKEEQDRQAKAKEEADRQAKAPAQAEAAKPAEVAPLSTQAQAAVTPAVAAPPTTMSAAQREMLSAAQLDKIRQQQHAYEAEELVRQGMTLQKQNRYSEALELYTRAVELDGANSQATAGRNQMLTLQGRPEEPTTLLAKQERLVMARREAITWSFNTSIANAKQDITNNEFAAAQAAVESARVARDQDPTIFTPAEINGFDRVIADTQLRLDQTAEGKKQTDADRAAEGVQKRMNDERERQQKERESTVADLINTAKQLIAQNKYREALAVIDQVRSLDPNNDYAIGVRPLIEDRAMLKEQREYREQFNRELVKQLNAAEEKKVPYDDIYRYPTNWPDISDSRDRQVQEERGMRQGDAAVRAMLERHLPELRFDNVGFADVVDFMRDVTGANIFVNWRAVEGAGVDRNAPVSARLRDVKFSKALTTILQDIGGGGVKLEYTVDEGVITISTEDDLASNKITQVYDVRDLAIDIPNFTRDNVTGSTTNNNNNNNNNSTNSTNGAWGGTTTGGGQGGRNPQGGVAALSRLISDIVAPDSWRTAGGTVGSIRQLAGQLIITQTPENHQKVQDLLAQLREARALQVTIEARFLTVQRNFLEDVGLDVDMAFNINDPNSHWSPIIVNQHSDEFTKNLTTPIPGSIGPNAKPMEISGTFLDDFQVNFLLRATQASQNSTVLTAPRVTLFNGQIATIQVNTTQSYVSNLQAVVAAGAVAYNPVVGTVPSGAVLQVQATVSADRKYVTLTVNPTLTQVVKIESFPVTSTVNTGVNGTGGTQVVTTSIQTPTLQVTALGTTVSVPDGGTLLLGGQTLAGEVNREQGVPVLSKIPFLKRLFTNRSMAKDENVLLILVKPTIIVQRELEQKQFPLLSSRVTGG